MSTDPTDLDLDVNLVPPESLTYRLRSDFMENRICQRVPVLDHGFVDVIDYMGGDPRVLQTARTSTAGAGALASKGPKKDRDLLRFLWRSNHTTCFESSSVTLRIKLPIFVARQLGRYRMATMSEESARYGALSEDCYLPELEVIGARPAGGNRQGRGPALARDAGIDVRDRLRAHNEESVALYRYLVSTDGDAPGLALELARLALPVSTYTTWVWTLNLHSLLHIMRQRLAPDAQYETREYARVIADIVKGWCPVTWEAFEDYSLSAVTSSHYVARAVRAVIERAGGLDVLAEELARESDSLVQSEIDGALKAWGAVSVTPRAPGEIVSRGSALPVDEHGFATATSDAEIPGLSDDAYNEMLTTLARGGEATDKMNFEDRIEFYNRVHLWRALSGPTSRRARPHPGPALPGVREQPAPVANDRTASWPLVIEQIEEDSAKALPEGSPSLKLIGRVVADMRARHELGIARYGRALQPFNGRDALVDLYQELLDALVYSQTVYSEEAERTPPALPADTLEGVAASLLELVMIVREGIAVRDGEP